ncbi:hypothetical protein CHGG_10512 [Chaetomium globosum CBS 148.51]|uniref:Uncharacterized protein n=1 Tax=Chaetomium globosum (strain ATCC 6205 / CBS 148.51 / DSM 1962 / NBRC 6347 / NRRL 1970) TaxID=306901 RepID=Q2GNE2_CHAGB|nr:uncharacterized protein CHGG_10512 [Chaetomium globosum CBS 148.51]EAQ84108.1 hypothetical protein CHGG_10512 [Chaetomium globosum CBS 148.51]
MRRFNPWAFTSRTIPGSFSPRTSLLIIPLSFLCLLLVHIILGGEDGGEEELEEVGEGGERGGGGGGFVGGGEGVAVAGVVVVVGFVARRFEEVGCEEGCERGEEWKENREDGEGGRDGQGEGRDGDVFVAGTVLVSGWETGGWDAYIATPTRARIT